MFKKKKNIDEDFMKYNTDSITTSNGNNNSFLGSVIQVLIILILIGVLAGITMFGYKYFTNDVLIPTSLQDTNKKMYSQEEMQVMMQMVMSQMKEQSAKPMSTTTNSDDNELISLLENAQVDQITDIDTVVDLDIKDIDKLKKITNEKDENSVENHNKVLIVSDNNGEDEIADLSKGLNEVLQNVQTKDTPTSEYTALISKEVSTRKDEMRTIIVEVGDSLSTIAKRAYGSIDDYDKLINANPELIKNPDFIYVGQRLRVPAI